MTIGTITAKIKLNVKLSLWQAIKMRISGIYKMPEYKIKLCDLIK